MGEEEQWWHFEKISLKEELNSGELGHCFEGLGERTWSSTGRLIPFAPARSYLFLFLLPTSVIAQPRPGAIQGSLEHGPEVTTPIFTCPTHYQLLVGGL